MAGRVIIGGVVLIAALTIGDSRLRPTDPFGGDTVAVDQGPMVTMWHDLSAKLTRDHLTVGACGEFPTEDCGPSLKLLEIINEAHRYEGKALIGHINRSINLLIKPAISEWINALETLKTADGDCKAYATAKYFALREAGVSPDHIRIVTGTKRRGGHMVVAVYQDGDWLILDNLTMLLVRDADARSNFSPILVFDDAGVRFYPASVIGIG